HDHDGGRQHAHSARPRLLPDAKRRARNSGAAARGRLIVEPSMTKRALITGITGQDGSYLAELLLEKGYEVHGMVRRSSEEKFERIAHLKGKILLHQGDLLDQFSLARLLTDLKPQEI